MRPILFLSPAEIVLFWSRVSRGNERECWEWTGPCNGDDKYGIFSAGRESRLAHRVAYFLGSGAISSELQRGEVSQRQLARKFGMSQATIGAMLRCKTWRHVQMT